MAGRRELDRGKLKELLVLLAEESRDDPRMSRVKWNKLMYRADFEAFRLLGQSITGATYIRGQHGPMVKDLQIYEDELGQAGRLEYWTDRPGPKPRKVPRAKGDPADRTKFAEGELPIIERSLEELKDYGGKAASDWSHEESAGWRLKPNDAEITYESGLIDTQRELEPDRLQALREYVDSLRQ